MHQALFVLAFQMKVAAFAAQPVALPADDSARTLSRVRDAQASFERVRRYALPPGLGSDGRCDVRLGRYCWWYDGQTPTFPPERPSVRERRLELLARLDSIALRLPGDDWIAAMRVHYRIDARDFAGADSAASSCRASAWWCAALVGYASHVNGAELRADSAFTVAIGAMDSAAACAWRSVAPLLAGGDRDRYEKLSCAERTALEPRFWLLSAAMLSAPGNEWRNEYNARRVVSWIASRSATPHALAWGDDAEELVLRYGWPIAWSRIRSNPMMQDDGGIIGHDPSPSFVFTPRDWLADTTSAVNNDAWSFDDSRGESRFAPRQVRRVAASAAQFARFRRGDSTLVVAAYAARDDSLRSPATTLAAASFDGRITVSAADSTVRGRARVTMDGRPLMAGTDTHDSSTHTLLRTRAVFAAQVDSGNALTLSDLLVFRPGESPAETLDSALVRAVAGDTVTRTAPIGLFWESYGLPSVSDTVDVSVSVERVDHGWIRSARQRLGLTPVDTPIRIKWTDPRAATSAAAGHSISLSLDNLDAGRYRITLALKPLNGRPALSAREIELIDR